MSEVVQEKIQKERCDAADAILDVKDIGNGKLLLTMADGWEDVLPKHGEDDPGVLIMWDDDNFAQTVANFNAAVVAGQVAPAWMGAHPFTVKELKRAILTRLQRVGRGGGVVGNLMIAPNDLDQFQRIVAVTTQLGFDPFVVANAVCPVGNWYVLADRQAKTTARKSAMPPPGVGAVPFIA